MLPRPPLRLLAVVLLAGCAHKVAITTSPLGARVSYRGEPLGVAPTTVDARWAPFRDMTVEVSLPGYRTTTLDLQKDIGPVRIFFEVFRPWRWDRWWGKEIRSRHEVLMVREHRPVGTWTPEDVRR